MINNRQAGRRNRGRNNNGGRPNGGNRGGGDNGNRIDSRARGNAAQLLEKYKNMARDAQMAGDRVNAEYYLQFADHYFRVLADNRARQEEQQQRFRPRDDGFEENFDDFDAGDEGGDDGRVDQSFDRGQDFDRRREEQRDYREGRNDRNRRDRNERSDRRRERPAAEEAAEQPRPQIAAEPVAPEPQAEAEPRARRGRPRKATANEEEQGGLDLAVLPPSIARADNDAEPAAEAPRKRTRRARPAAEAAE
ncbi:hypothetical protein Sphch_2288 [Sphingobium chlorophenolicum L-1]|uniref:DUF4167 domain-containing protein n=1 Tax=Sphingobium chlorophenolicum L-1 TaxID=690566 RepID=F6EXC8_SPHCR|nr:DUF4167 domain-containing protein [Sphingobium chlorophenolicum]AEG49949.1 hypothetical protein Sphch_2288 [Sphingobium chlorophenolicum L-1]